ncbi:uroporphyrinogen decarboxylase [Formosa sp. 3Alg 14/1]|uniref:uroporphyrinogen decarboxylase n=1 Tax=unclassified Formosa TaxID=2644710 RepID=UPI0039BECACA
MDVLGISVTEWIGYLASFVLLISFTMKDVVKLRIVNTIGCAFFVAYGFMLETSWPIVITNAAIILINFYYLFLKKK